MRPSPSVPIASDVYCPTSPPLSSAILLKPGWPCVAAQTTVPSLFTLWIVLPAVHPFTSAWIPRLVLAAVAVAPPVPPCATDSGVLRPESDVMSELAPEAAAPRFALAPLAVADPVPPFATGTTPRSAMFGAVPPLEASGLDAVTEVTPSSSTPSAKPAGLLVTLAQSTVGASGPSSGGGAK